MSLSGKLRPLNRPRPVRVHTDKTGCPTRVQTKGQWKNVGSVLDQWRIDDEWWREPISRTYFSLVLENGAHLTAYHDLMEDRWYQQSQ